MRCKQNPKKEIRFEPPVRESSKISLKIWIFELADLVPEIFLRASWDNRQDQWRAVPTPAWHLYGAAPCEDMIYNDPWRPWKKRGKKPRRVWRLLRRSVPYFGQAVRPALKDVTSDNRKNLLWQRWCFRAGFWILDFGFCVISVDFRFVALHGWRQRWESLKLSVMTVMTMMALPE